MLLDGVSLIFSVGLELYKRNEVFELELESRKRILESVNSQYWATFDKYMKDNAEAIRKDAYMTYYKERLGNVFFHFRTYFLRYFLVFLFIFLILREIIKKK